MNTHHPCDADKPIHTKRHREDAGQHEPAKTTWKHSMHTFSRETHAILPHRPQHTDPVHKTPSLCMSLARSMLNFDLGAFDLYFVYEGDFIREVRHIIEDGLVGAGLQVQPVSSAATSFSADFGWKPDGPYAVFVRMSAVIFIALEVATGTMAVPGWLIEDLAKLDATFVRRGSGSQSDRALLGLKATILASKQNRAADPLLIDHMLSNNGMATEQTATAFIDRYNASVRHDQSLQLKEHASRRQANLLDPKRCTPAMKAAMKSAVNDAENFDDTGLSLQILALDEFWVGCVFVNSSHSQWRILGRTSPLSCLKALKVLLEQKKAEGKKMSAPAFRDLSRHLAVFQNMCDGLFRRKGVKQNLLDDFSQRVVDGLYDDDLNLMIAECDENVPQGDDAKMDAFLVEASALAHDLIEVHESRANVDHDANARKEAAVGMTDSQWFLAELAHDVLVFNKYKGERATLLDGLKGKEKEYDSRVQRNVQEATTPFAEKNVPMLNGQENGFVAKLMEAMNTKAASLGREFGCDSTGVLRVVFVDMPGP